MHDIGSIKAVHAVCTHDTILVITSGILYTPDHQLVFYCQKILELCLLEKLVCVLEVSMLCHLVIVILQDSQLVVLSVLHALKHE